MSDKKRYACDRCGLCCQKLIVEADWLDVVREPRLIEADPHWSKKKMTPLEVIDALEEEGKIIHVAIVSRCHFLGKENACQIYPTRPNVCVGFQAGDVKCQELREEHGLPRLEPLAA